MRVASFYPAVLPAIYVPLWNSMHLDQEESKLERQKAWVTLGSLWCPGDTIKINEAWKLK